MFGWHEILGVTIGGAAGSLARYGATLLLSPRQGFFPWAILLVNVTGCLLIGIVGQLATEFPKQVPDWLKVTLATGFLGGLTTFSTFGENTYRQLLAGEWLFALFNIAANVLLGLGAVALGVALVRSLT